MDTSKKSKEWLRLRDLIAKRMAQVEISYFDNGDYFLLANDIMDIFESVREEGWKGEQLVATTWEEDSSEKGYVDMD